MDRWARPNEVKCGAGACRNVATWVLRSDRGGRNWVSCNLHLPSRRRLMVERHEAYRPVVEPLHDL